MITVCPALPRCRENGCALGRSLVWVSWAGDRKETLLLSYAQLCETKLQLLSYIQKSLNKGRKPSMCEILANSTLLLGRLWLL